MIYRVDLTKKTTERVIDESLKVNVVKNRTQLIQIYLSSNLRITVEFMTIKIVEKTKDISIEIFLVNLKYWEEFLLTATVKIN